MHNPLKQRQVALQAILHKECWERDLISQDQARAQQIADQHNARLDKEQATMNRLMLQLRELLNNPVGLDIRLLRTIQQLIFDQQQILQSRYQDKHEADETVQKLTAQVSRKALFTKGLEKAMQRVEQDLHAQFLKQQLLQSEQLWLLHKFGG